MSFACQFKLSTLSLVAAVVLTVFCFSSYWYLIVWPWELWASALGWVQLIIFHCLFIFQCISMFLTTSTSPGIADKNYVPRCTEEELEDAKDPRNDEKNIPNLENADFFRPRWCHRCQAFKCPRSYHCSEWNVCVLRMDHYCPWVNNCIGYKNHKFFVLFLFYSSICLIYFLACCIIRVARLPFSASPQLAIPEIIIFSLHVIVTLPATIGITGLFGYQIFCLKDNVTSVETFSRARYKKAAMRSGEKFIWFYDFGCYNNLKQFLGSSVFEWFIPIMPHHIRVGDGKTFHTRGLTKDTNEDNTVEIVITGPKKRNVDTEEEQLLQ